MTFVQACWPIFAPSNWAQCWLALGQVKTRNSVHQAGQWTRLDAILFEPPAARPVLMCCTPYKGADQTNHYSGKAIRVLVRVNAKHVQLVSLHLVRNSQVRCRVDSQSSLEMILRRSNGKDNQVGNYESTDKGVELDSSSELGSGICHHKVDSSRCRWAPGTPGSVGVPGKQPCGRRALSDMGQWSIRQAASK